MMKLTHYKKCLVLAFTLAGAFFAVAQTNPVPGPTDYSSFSRFITERNIFDPNRYSHTVTRTYHPTRPTRSTPTFTLVGTMSYQKGLFAFFDGNNSDLRKVLAQSGTIAGFTVAEVTLTGATLETADKKQTVQLKIGEMMRQEGTQWQLAGQGEIPSVTEENTAPAADDSSPAGTPASSPTGPQSDILKKLMQLREKELK